MSKYKIQQTTNVKGFWSTFHRTTVSSSILTNVRESDVEVKIHSQELSQFWGELVMRARELFARQ